MLTKKTPIRNLLFLIQKSCFRSASSSAAATLSPPTSPPLPAPNSSSSASFTVQYLVKSCGLSLQSAISVSHEFQIHQNKLQNAQSVLHLLKVEMFKSLRWTEEEILLTFKRCPQVLSCSEKKIKSAMDFYVNTMRMGPHTVIAHPLFLRFSIDKRIRPRYTVVKTLESKKLIQEEKKIAKFLSISEKKFMEIYVTKYADHVPDLLEIYRGTSKAIKMDT